MFVTAGALMGYAVKCFMVIILKTIILLLLIQLYTSWRSEHV